VERGDEAFSAARVFFGAGRAVAWIAMRSGGVRSVSFFHPSLLPSTWSFLFFQNSVGFIHVEGKKVKKDQRTDLLTLSLLKSNGNGI
jgi:hypothetical protein